MQASEKPSQEANEWTLAKGETTQVKNSMGSEEMGPYIMNLLVISDKESPSLYW